MKPLPAFLDAKRLLLAVAAPGEARAVVRGCGGDAGLLRPDWRLHALGDRLDLVITGVGKANAAGAVGSVLDASRHGAVVSVGVAGLLPTTNAQGLGVLSVVAATESVFADEGLLCPDGFQSVAQMGFPPIPGGEMAFPGDPALLGWLLPLADASGPIATVSTCSGTAALAREIAARTGALAEGMEGAAVALAAARLGVPFAELRVISNTTGDRAGQTWDLRGALDRLGALAGALAG